MIERTLLRDNENYWKRGIRARDYQKGKVEIVLQRLKWTEIEGYWKEGKCERENGG